jgi:hypothetical protein
VELRRDAERGQREDQRGHAQRHHRLRTPGGQQVPAQRAEQQPGEVVGVVVGLQRDPGADPDQHGGGPAAAPDRERAEHAADGDLRAAVPAGGARIVHAQRAQGRVGHVLYGEDGGVQAVRIRHQERQPGQQDQREAGEQGLAAGPAGRPPDRAGQREKQRQERGGPGLGVHGQRGAHADQDGPALGDGPDRQRGEGQREYVVEVRVSDAGQRPQRNEQRAAAQDGPADPARRHVRTGGVRGALEREQDQQAEQRHQQLGGDQAVVRAEPGDRLGQREGERAALQPRVVGEQVQSPGSLASGRTLPQQLRALCGEVPGLSPVESLGAEPQRGPGDQHRPVPGIAAQRIPHLDRAHSLQEPSYSVVLPHRDPAPLVARATPITACGKKRRLARPGCAEW